MSDFQKCLDSSLVNGLRSIYKNHWSSFCDLKISCGDGQTVIAPKLILAVHSDYFSALLKHEPETTTISLPQFDSALVTFVIKSLVDFDENDFEDVELGQVVSVADYFQMKLHMPNCLPRLLLMKINLKVRYLTSKTPHPNTEFNLI